MIKDRIGRILIYLAALYTYIYIAILLEGKKIFFICGISVPIQILILACIGLLLCKKKNINNISM